LYGTPWARSSKAHSRTKEFLHHLSVAKGSLAELETHLLLSQRIGYLDPAGIESLLTQTCRIGRMLSGLRKALENRL